MKNSDITQKVISAAIEVHSKLGPGLLESTYVTCLSHELLKRGISIEKERPVPLVYKGNHLEHGYRIDILVEEKVVLELKAVEAINEVHRVQILTYMKLVEFETGLLINFNTIRLVDGLKRFVM